MTSVAVLNIVVTIMFSSSMPRIFLVSDFHMHFYPNIAELRIAVRRLENQKDKVEKQNEKEMNI